MEQTKTKAEKRIEPVHIIASSDSENPTVDKEAAISKNGKVKNKPSSSGKSFISDSVNFSETPSFPQSLISQNFISIDIDTDSIRFIIGSSLGKKLFVKDTGISLISSEESDREKALKLTLDNIKANVYKTGYKIHVSFFSPDVTVRQYQLPKMRKVSELKNAIFYKLESDLPGFNENSSWRYRIIEDPKSGNLETQRVVVLVFPVKIVNRCE